VASTDSSGLPGGVLVLGAHRSGTSLLAGIVAALGLAPGPAERLRAPDQFNPGGYYEDRAVVKWHDAILQRCGGWASAPPDSVAVSASDIAALATVLAPYATHRWFVKDPRQCLVLGGWEQARGTVDRAVAIVRAPADATVSLRRRSTYPPATGFALWERYNNDLLRCLAGRPTLLLTHDRLVDRPIDTIAKIVEFLQPLVDRPHEDALRRIGAGVHRSATSDLRVPPACAALMALAVDLAGVHQSFPTVDLPPLSPSGCRTIRRRRALLNAIRPLRLSTSTRTTMDEALGKMRARIRNHSVRDGVTN
jgi:hypothetical protein